MQRLSPSLITLPQCQTAVLSLLFFFNLVGTPLGQLNLYWGDTRQVKPPSNWFCLVFVRPGAPICRKITFVSPLSQQDALWRFTKRDEIATRVCTRREIRGNVPTRTRLKTRRVALPKDMRFIVRGARARLPHFLSKVMGPRLLTVWLYIEAREQP